MTTDEERIAKMHNKSISWQHDDEEDDWYEDGYCSECDDRWNIDSHAWRCPNCDTKLIEVKQ
tara:strand:+ start:664 stop:849 length:186 start_codon:yes stop_codon:yes gene_type:complete